VVGGEPRGGERVPDKIERVARTDAYLSELRGYKAQSRYMREKDDTPARSVSGPPRKPMNVGRVAQAPTFWRPVRWTANTNSKSLGGPGDMRLQGKRFENAWEDCTRASEPRVWERMVDHQLCHYCGYRIDLEKHDYYTMPGGEMQCDRCEWLQDVCQTCGQAGCV
jgi:hypothetical protein